MLIRIFVLSTKDHLHGKVNLFDADQGFLSGLFWKIPCKPIIMSERFKDILSHCFPACNRQQKFKVLILLIFSLTWNIPRPSFLSPWTMLLGIIATFDRGGGGRSLVNGVCCREVGRMP